MRLRQLNYPILIVYPDGLNSGRDGGLGSQSRFDYDLAENYLSGRFDKAVIYDSSGRKFEVNGIELVDISIWTRFKERAGNLFFLPPTEKRPVASVDAELRQLGQLNFTNFLKEILEVAKAHPLWWPSHVSSRNIDEMFSGASDVEDAINQCIILDRIEGTYSAPTSTKVNDLRSSQSTA